MQGMRLWLGAALVALAPGAAWAQVPSAVAENLSLASRILADQNVVDAFGHVSMRNPDNPKHFFMPRSLAPALTSAADIMEFDENSNASIRRAGRSFSNASSTAKSIVAALM